MSKNENEDTNNCNLHAGLRADTDNCVPPIQSLFCVPTDGCAYALESTCTALPAVQSGWTLPPQLRV